MLRLFFQTDTETFFRPNFFETDTDTLKILRKFSIPKSLETWCHTLKLSRSQEFWQTSSRDMPSSQSLLHLSSYFLLSDFHCVTFEAGVTNSQSRLWSSTLETKSQKVKFQFFRHLGNLREDYRQLQIFSILDCNSYWVCLIFTADRCRFSPVNEAVYKFRKWCFLLAGRAAPGLV